MISIAAFLSAVWLATALPADPTCLEAGAGRTWVGTERGLYRLTPTGLESVWPGAPIRALAGTSDELWIATPRGLARWTPARGVERQPALAPGAQVLGLAVAGGELFAATDAGLFSGRAGAFARDASLPPGGVDAVASDGAEVWVARRGALYARGADGRFRTRLRAQPPGWWELLAVLPGPTLVVPEGLWLAAGDLPERRRALRPPLRAAAAHPGGTPALASADALGRLGDPAPLALPELAGAELRDLLARGDGGWLVLTATGVLELAPSAADLAERTTPSGPGALRGPDLSRSDLALPAAEPPDAGAPSPGSAAPALAPVALAPAPAPLLPAPPPAEPEAELFASGAVPIAALHAAVLHYLELQPRRLGELEQRARRSLWLPELRFNSGLDRERSRAHERNQSMNAGSVRNLLDGARGDQGNWNFDVQLVWNLAGAVDPAPLLQVSRERRELIELRDQILERVDRAYFERLRVQARRRSLPAASADERAELWLRERELAAQLDAWSGGAFSELLARESAPGAAEEP